MGRNRAFTIKLIKTGKNHQNASPRGITNPQFIAVEFVLKECSSIYNYVHNILRLFGG